MFLSIFAIIATNFFLIVKKPLPVSYEIVTSSLFSHFNEISLRLITFLILLFALLLFSKKNPSKFYTFLTLPWLFYLSNQSPAAIFLLILATFFLLAKQSLPYLVLTIVFSFIYLNQIQEIKSFLPNFQPQNLAISVIERQRHSPSNLSRKLTYNKLTHTTNLVFNHSISFFDFEQWSSPRDSYELIKLSSLPPKNNPLLLFSWQIPIIFIGLLTKKPGKKLLTLASFGLFFYFLFDKKYLGNTSFLVLPLTLDAYYNGLTQLTRKVKLTKLVFIALSLISILIYLSSYHNHPEKYFSTDLIYHQKIASWLRNSGTKYENIVITNRFGPTETFIPYYYKENNVVFRNLQPKDITNTNSIYIGLSGEFIGEGKNTDSALFPTNLTLLGKIIGEDEVVFEHGKEIWIVKPN